MAKIADIYYSVDPWNIIENGFNPAYSQVSESIFSLGNEYMGVRGYLEEGYSGESLIGSYLNGVYETQEIGGSAYKGIIDKTEFMVNSVDWLYLRIRVDGETVDLGQSQFRNFERSLDLKTGVLTRSFIWILPDGRELELEFERFLSMKDAHLAGQRLCMTALNFTGQAVVTAGLDFSPVHQMVGKNLWNIMKQSTGEHSCSIMAGTVNTEQPVFSYCHFTGDIGEEKDLIEDKKVLKQFTFDIKQGVEATLTRVVMNLTMKGTGSEDFGTFNVKCEEKASLCFRMDYDGIKMESILWWKEIWQNSDIVIEGDDLNQQGIRYCIFQMHQTYHGADNGTIIGAKGLTGEAYSGNTFWDTETYCLPFYIFNNVEAAKHLLMFRANTLPEAKERAKALDCKGAFYPIATISGRECCSLWQHASTQLQASTAVVYGFRHYETITKDEAFVFKTGLPVLVEVSRMLSTRGDWNISRTRYGFYGVMGPDEFQMMVNNNCFTNFMGKTTLLYTLEVLERLRKKDVPAYEAAMTDLNLTKEECRSWADIAEHMYIPYDEDTKLFEQHEGYFSLPHIDVDQIPVGDFPLYHHWSYDRIYRNDMIKQPDVLMMMLLYNQSFSPGQLKNNYEYYEPRCIHESSLSPSVHSILAVQLHKHEEAYTLFGFATRMDLDNYNRNTSEGLHTTSIAAAWMNIVYGFAGMRSDRELLSFSPSIPASWNKYSFCIQYQDDSIHVEIDKENARFYTVNGADITVSIYGKPTMIKKEELVVEIPRQWRGSLRLG